MRKVKKIQLGKETLLLLEFVTAEGGVVSSYCAYQCETGHNPCL